MIFSSLHSWWQSVGIVAVVMLLIWIINLCIRAHKEDNIRLLYFAVVLAFIQVVLGVAIS